MAASAIGLIQNRKKSQVSMIFRSYGTDDILHKVVQIALAFSHVAIRKRSRVWPLDDQVDLD
jgi:hypothetical protein